MNLLFQLLLAVILALKVKEHKYYEIRWYRGNYSSLYIILFCIQKEDINAKLSFEYTCFYNNIFIISKNVQIDDKIIKLGV